MGGYHGRYLRIDVGNGTAEWVPLAEPLLRRFIGGVGLGTWLLHREGPTRGDPLAADAPLIFCFSPLVGTPLTTSAKFAVVAKSPLTFRLNDALSSSHFALAGKRTGADAFVIIGACPEPSLLFIEDGRVWLEPAGDLWGLCIDEAGQRLEAQWPAHHAAVIGPAGENCVRYATISHAQRHAGRGGLGAVMGSKRLKAILVAGNQRVPVADPAGVAATARDLSKRSFGPATAKYRELGTVANLLIFNRLHALPTRNFQEGRFEEAQALADDSLSEARRLARNSCAACTIGCEHIYASADGPVRLEYETLFALGPLCGIGDREVVLRAARLCDRLGLDTISTGATIAFAMECNQRGLLDADGVDFGNGAMLLSLLPRIARREEGLANLLAEGTRRAAMRLGGNAADFAPHVKGLEIPGYEPRALQTMALGFAVGSRGADHNRSGAYEADFSPDADRVHGSPEAAALAVDTEDRAALFDSLILCKFLRGVFSDFYQEAADMLAQVTGWRVTAAELRQAAARIVTAKKLYNIREGWTPEEDMLPKRFLSEPLAMVAEKQFAASSEKGANNGQEAVLPRERLEGMIAAYYAKRGWTARGDVPETLVEELELKDVVR